MADTHARRAHKHRSGDGGADPLFSVRHDHVQPASRSCCVSGMAATFSVRHDRVQPASQAPSL